MSSAAVGTASLLVLAGLLSCASAPERTKPAEALRPEEAARLVPPSVRDRAGWASDAVGALSSLGLTADADTLCQLFAVVEQESGFQADPQVPGLSKLVRAQLEQKAGALGAPGALLLRTLLTGPFESRIAALRTEQDLDRLFRDVVDHFGVGFGADWNPVTTVGSMQVSVAWSEERMKALGGEPAKVRDLLYTRAGGLSFGAARLLLYRAHYPRPLFRFADYNAGLYSSRNAAVQEALSGLTGLKLALDGDLLAWERPGVPAERESASLQAALRFRERFARGLSEERVRQDLLLEKTAAFEETATWRALQRAQVDQTGSPAPYARVPDVALRSAKLKEPRSTAWYAQGVERRYRQCLERL